MAKDFSSNQERAAAAINLKFYFSLDTFFFKGASHEFVLTFFFVIEFCRSVSILLLLVRTFVIITSLTIQRSQFCVFTSCLMLHRRPCPGLIVNINLS